MKAITRLILAIVVAASRGVSAQASTPQVVTFNNDDSLTDITSIIQATSQYRLASAGSGRTLKAADPLTQSLNNYVNSFSNPTVELLPLTSDIVINTTARIAELPQSKHLLTLTDQLHQWLADPANEASIKDALDANSTLQNIEQLQYENSTMVCERLFQYSNNVVSGLPRPTAAPRAMTCRWTALGLFALPGFTRTSQPSCFLLAPLRKLPLWDRVYREPPHCRLHNRVVCLTKTLTTVPAHHRRSATYGKASCPQSLVALICCQPP